VPAGARFSSRDDNTIEARNIDQGRKATII